MIVTVDVKDPSVDVSFCIYLDDAYFGKKGIKIQEKGKFTVNHVCNCLGLPSRSYFVRLPYGKEKADFVRLSAPIGGPGGPRITVFDSWKWSQHS